MIEIHFFFRGFDFLSLSRTVVVFRMDSNKMQKIEDNDLEDQNLCIKNDWGQWCFWKKKVQSDCGFQRIACECRTLSGLILCLSGLILCLTDPYAEEKQEMNSDDDEDEENDNDNDNEGDEEKKSENNDSEENNGDDSEKKVKNRSQKKDNTKKEEEDTERYKQAKKRARERTKSELEQRKEQWKLALKKNNRKLKGIAADKAWKEKVKAISKKGRWIVSLPHLHIQQIFTDLSQMQCFILERFQWVAQQFKLDEEEIHICESPDSLQNVLHDSYLRHGFDTMLDPFQCMKIYIQKFPKICVYWAGMEKNLFARIPFGKAPFETLEYKQQQQQTSLEQHPLQQARNSLWDLHASLPCGWRLEDLSNTWKHWNCVEYLKATYPLQLVYIDDFGYQIRDYELETLRQMLYSLEEIPVSIPFPECPQNPITVHEGTPNDCGYDSQEEEEKFPDYVFGPNDIEEEDQDYVMTKKNVLIDIRFNKPKPMFKGLEIVEQTWPNWFEYLQNGGKPKAFSIRCKLCPNPKLWSNENKLDKNKLKDGVQEKIEFLSLKEFLQFRTKHLIDFHGCVGANLLLGKKTKWINKYVLQKKKKIQSQERKNDGNESDDESDDESSDDDGSCNKFKYEDELLEQICSKLHALGFVCNSPWFFEISSA